MRGREGRWGEGVGGKVELFANKVRIPSANILNLNIFTYEGAGGEVEVRGWEGSWSCSLTKYVFRVLTY